MVGRNERREDRGSGRYEAGRLPKPRTGLEQRREAGYDFLRVTQEAPKGRLPRAPASERASEGSVAPGLSRQVPPEGV